MASLRGAGEFLQESLEELRRVTWPDWPQLRSATLVVILFCILVAAIIWVMDSLSSFLIVDVIMRLFGA